MAYARGMCVQRVVFNVVRSRAGKTVCLFSAAKSFEPEQVEKMDVIHSHGIFVDSLPATKLAETFYVLLFVASFPLSLSWGHC